MVRELARIFEMGVVETNFGVLGILNLKIAVGLMCFEAKKVIQSGIVACVGFAGVCPSTVASIVDGVDERSIALVVMYNICAFSDNSHPRIDVMQQACFTADFALCKASMS